MWIHLHCLPCVFNERVNWTNLSIPNLFSKCVNSMKWPWRGSRLTHNGILIESHLALMGAVGQLTLPSWQGHAISGTCCSVELSTFVALNVGCYKVRRKEEITLSPYADSLWANLSFFFLLFRSLYRFKIQVQSVKQSKLEFC